MPEYYSSETDAQQSKKIQKKQNDRWAKKQKKGENKKTSLILLKALLYVICCSLIAIQGMERIEAANELKGSTDSVIKAAEDSVNATGSSELGFDRTVIITEYKYIPETELRTMSYAELAEWYLQQFPDAEHTNTTAKQEFDSWFMDEILMGTRTQEEFNIAIETAKTSAEQPQEETQTEPEPESESEPEPEIETPAETVPSASQEPESQTQTVPQNVTTTETTTEIEVPQ